MRKEGMQGGGTLDEISEFMGLVEQVQQDAEHVFAVGLIHHENRQGQISGAWEGVPDTLMHVQAQGHGRTRLFWQKCKWSSPLHQTTMHLAWADGETFELEQREEITEASIADAILEAARQNPGASWTEQRKNVKGKSTTDATRVRDRLINDGLLTNGSTRAGQFNLWATDDPALPRSESGTALERLVLPVGKGGCHTGPFHRSARKRERRTERNGTADTDARQLEVTL